MWYNFFDSIQVINLEKRIDRLVDFCVEMEKVNVPFKIKNAVEHDNGAEGLRLTMLEVFREAVRLNYDNILVFEDDAMWVNDVHDTMNKVVEQLPKDYMMCYLGCQPSRGYTHFHSPNLLPVIGAYATHAVAYSRRAINFILASSMYAPIDNFYVNHIQPAGGIFQVHPFLCTQRAGYSDIGKEDIDWNPYLLKQHEEKLLQCRI